MVKYFISILILFSFNSFSQEEIHDTIRIKLFSNVENNSGLFKVRSGKYDLIALDNQNNLIDTIAKIDSKDKANNDIFYISNQYDLLAINQKKRMMGYYQNIILKPRDQYNCSFIVASGEEKERIYDGALQIKLYNEHLELINEVSLDSYVAGVVESEVGGLNGNIEFFKVKALVVRTYAIKHYNRFTELGYNLTDDVRSQVYHSKAIHIRSNIIQKAVKQTSNMVIVDSKNNIIFPAFHANSGGQTSNSGEVWQTQLPYLTSIEDKYSLMTRKDSVYWEKSIGKQEYYDFLKSVYPKAEDDKEFLKYASNFVQKKRLEFISYGEIEIPLKEIRQKFNLRSTFFDIKSFKGKIIFKGRGYGHGVGLSQVGAKYMAEKGKKCDDIVKFYYKDVKIVNYHDAIIE
jgi:stage II sporulation protein D